MEGCLRSQDLRLIRRKEDSERRKPEAIRGGRAKKHVVLTRRGWAALREADGAIARMAEGVPGL